MGTHCYRIMAVTRLPRGSQREGLRCPVLRPLSTWEAAAQQRGRELLRMASPEASAWVEFHLEAEARLWDLVAIELP